MRTTKIELWGRLGFTLLAALLLTLCVGAAAWADDNPGQAPGYSITLPADTVQGAVTADRTEAAEGETVTLTVSPGTGYALDDLYGTYPNGTEGTRYFYPKGERNVFHFTMPAGDVTVTAMFDQAELSLSDGGSTYFYTPRRAKNAFSDIPDGAAGWTVTLLEDFSCSNIEVAQNKTATLDLNGHILWARIPVSGNLTLTDSAPSTAHDPALTYTDPITGEAVAVTGGAIIGGSNGSGVSVNGTFTMEGGSITGTNYSGVSVNGGVFTMTGGSITGNSATSYGGGVSVNGGVFTMTGGSITGNSATSYGGGVYVRTDGTFTMNGGSITGNSAGRQGGGVYVNGTFTMNGGSITGNSATNYGGGVYVYNNGTFRLEGAPEISGNTGDQIRLRYNENTEKGAHITVVGELTNTTPIGVSMDNPGVFTEGLAGKGTAANFTSDSADYRAVLNTDGECTLAPLQPITTPADSEQGTVSITEIGGTSVTEAAASAAGGELVTLTVTPAQGQLEPTPKQGYLLRSLIVSYTDGEGTAQQIQPRQDENDASKYTFTMPAHPVTVSATFSAASAWGDLQELLNRDEYVRVPQDLTAGTDDGPLYIIDDGREITLDLNGHTLSRGLSEAKNDGHVITVMGSLELVDYSGEKTGRLTGGNSSGSAGGVCVKNDGLFKLSSGKISGNSAAQYGGGVYVEKGIFTMVGGTIESNRAQVGGGGVFASNATSQMAFRLFDGLIDGNFANKGGGVYANDGNILLYGGTISGNKCGADGCGGGLYTANYTSVQIHGNPVIQGNTRQSVVPMSGEPDKAQADNLCLGGQEPLWADGDMTNSTPIGVTTDPMPDGSAQVMILSNDENTYRVGPENFTSDLGGFAVCGNSRHDAVFLVKTASVPEFGQPDFTLPAAITAIGESAFEGAAMTVVFIPDSCTSVGANAFKNCTELTQIRLPKNCAINDEAFSGCTSLITVYAPAGGTTQSWCVQAGILFIEE